MRYLLVIFLNSYKAHPYRLGDQMSAVFSIEFFFENVAMRDHRMMTDEQQ